MNPGVTVLIKGKRHFAPTFHYGFPEEIFVTISRHSKIYIIVGMTKILKKQGCSE
jgi:hypothetical protein